MQFQTSMFHYDPTDRTFSQAASSLGDNIFHRVYQDACDRGITLVSDKTGQSVDYAVVSEDRNRDGEIEGWWLVPTREALRKCRSACNTKILIIND